MRSAETFTDHRQRILETMVYINENLGERLSLDRVAKVACFSPFHFIRTFESLMGETPGQYITRKRIEQAGFRLLKGEKRVTDIALDLGYGTPSSFSKGFKRHFGMSPRRFRDRVHPGRYLKMNHPFRSAPGRQRRLRAMPRPMVGYLPEIRVVCIENRGVVNGGFLCTNLKAFKEFREKTKGLHGILGNTVGIYPNRPQGLHDKEVTNFVGAIINRYSRLAKGFRFLVYPPGKYAVFHHFGAYKFSFQTWNQAYINWLPRSGLALRDLPPLEIHLDPPAPDNTLPLKFLLLIAVW